MKWLKFLFNNPKKTEEEKNISFFSIKIPESPGNRYVISDIHGCLQTFKAIISKLKLTYNDQLFLLGDYIDKGKNSQKVIDYIIELQKEFQIFPLRGNHEEDLLQIVEFDSKSIIKRYIKKENNQTLFNSDFIIEKKYIDFINDLPYFIELENCILVHAGIDLDAKNPFDEIDEMLWIRKFEYNSDIAKGKQIIHGHTPHTFEEIKSKIENNEKIIPLDNGCVFKDIEGYGNLLCLNISTNQLICQKNIEN